VAKVLAAEGYIISKQAVWATIRKYKMHGTLSRLPGSGRRFKLTPDILAIIEEQMRVDDETTATQLVKARHLQEYNYSTSKIEGTGKASLQSFGVGRNLKKRCH